jgi:hypothetical protein
VERVGEYAQKLSTKTPKYVEKDFEKGVDKQYCICYNNQALERVAITESEPRGLKKKIEKSSKNF